MKIGIEKRNFIFAALALAAIAVALRAPATAAAQGDTGVDPPGRVARLNFVQGAVSFQPAGGGSSDWVAAEVNRPLTTGDQLWSDTDGLVEMHIGSTAVRMGYNTGASFLNLSDNVIQLQVSAGSVIVRLRELDPNDAFEVDTPNLAFSLLQPGTYEIDVDPDSDVTVVTVVAGSGLVTGGGRSWNITPDQQATFTGSDTLDYSLEDADSLPQTDFENWSAQRDRMENNVMSARYVSPDTTGYEDLDAYGDWSDQPQYGSVWFPRGVALGWAPYRIGHWVWIAPWGWTWVDSEPWGFAPFHYGRWAAFGGRWGWVPGPYAAGVRPVYAPALVAWVGGSPGFSFSIAIGGGGGIAWFPLGPREVFMPTYRVSENYITRVNVTNTVVDRVTVDDVYRNNARNVTYANQRVEGGVTVVSHDTFVSGGFVSRNVVNVSARDLASAPVNRGGPAAEPTRASVSGGAEVSTHRPPESVENRPAVAVRTPPAQPQGFRGNGAANGGGGNSMNRPPNEPENAPPNRTMNGPGGNESAPPANMPPTNAPDRGNEGGNNRGYNPPNNSPMNNPPMNNPPANDAGNGRNNNRGNDNNRGNNQPPAPTPPPQPEQPPVPPPHNNVRQAPPVQQPTPEEQQNDSGKQQGWQQKHEQVHQNPTPPSTPTPAPTPAPKPASTPPSNAPSNGKDNHPGGGQNSNPPKPPHS
jgi:hypothetical protein